MFLLGRAAMGRTPPGPLFDLTDNVKTVSQCEMPSDTRMMMRVGYMPYVAHRSVTVYYCMDNNLPHTIR